MKKIKHKGSSNFMDNVEELTVDCKTFKGVKVGSGFCFSCKYNKGVTTTIVKCSKLF